MPGTDLGNSCMKKEMKFGLVIMVLLTTCVITNAQITIREKAEKPIAKNLVYDSLNNFGRDLFGDKVDCFEDFVNKNIEGFETKSELIENAKGVYQQYVGQQLFILPRPKHGSKWGDVYADLRGNYYTIVDIEYEVYEKSYNGKCSLYEMTISLDNGNGKKIKKTVYVHNLHAESLIVGFYEKLKALYVDSVFVYTGKAVGDFGENITAKITNTASDQEDKIVFLHVGEKWTCSDFQIVDDDFIVQLYAVLHNEKGTEILARLHNTFLFEGELNMAFFSCFAKESEFMAWKKGLVDRYGEENANLISLKKVAIGMTKQMCIESWGLPNRINTTIVSDEATEQWVYPRDSYLYFKEDVLTAIQQ